MRLLVLTEDLQQAALALAETEKFHPDPRPPAEERLGELHEREYQENYQQARSRLDKIGHLIPVPEPQLDTIRVVTKVELQSLNAWLREARQQCMMHEETAHQVDEAERQLSEEETLLANFAELDIDLGILQRDSRFLDIRVGVMPRENRTQLADALDLAGFILFDYAEHGDQAHVVIAGPSGRKESEIRSLLASASFREIPVPPELDDAPEAIRERQRERRREIEDRRRQLSESLDACALQFRERLQEASTLLALAEPFVTLDPSIRSSGYLATLAGWVPARAVDDLQQRLADSLPHPFRLETRKPHSDERSLVPTLPTTNPLLQPFQTLVQQYGIPRYGEFDPTALFTITFLLMFGTMFGDVGHGAVLAGLALAFRRKLGHFYRFGVMAGLSSILFGFLFGSVFGYKDILPAVWMSPLYDPILMLQLALGWGVLFITLACVLTVYNRLVIGEPADAVFGHHGALNLLFYLALVAGGVGLVSGEGFGLLPTGTILVSLLAMAVYSWRELTAPVGEKILVIAIETLETVIGYISNTLSFLRVAAFSINHVALAIAVLTLASMMGTIGHVLMVILGNIFIIVLEGVIVTIQVMRLQYFEGFSRYFSADGHEFAPLRLRGRDRKAT
ncbi:MAG: V-type ATP synthase subunit I [Pseudomonadota bacterium]